jgi:hypothetical protein
MRPDENQNLCTFKLLVVRKGSAQEMNVLAGSLQTNHLADTGWWTQVQCLQERSQDYKHVPSRKDPRRI